MAGGGAPWQGVVPGGGGGGWGFGLSWVMMGRAHVFGSDFKWALAQ
jgi:hypothetical protein